MALGWKRFRYPPRPSPQIKTLVAVTKPGNNRASPAPTTVPGGCSPVARASQGSRGSTTARSSRSNAQVAWGWGESPGGGLLAAGPLSE